MNELWRVIGNKVISKLLKNGYQAYYVGGLVRDYILKKSIKDIDITTDALPNELISMFENVVPTGIKHGTVTVIIGNIPIEITTFRVESEYVDHRRPENVFFIKDLYLDLARRDFTINAIAMNMNYELIDPFNGLIDIEQKLIRTVGKAQERFLEDPLRILRAIRFVGELGFNITDTTLDAIILLKNNLLHIAKERIYQEFNKLMVSNYTWQALQYLVNLNILPVLFFNKQTNFLIRLDNLKFQNITLVNDVNVRWAYLFIQLDLFNYAKEIMSNLKFPKQQKREILFLMKLRNIEINTWIVNPYKIYAFLKNQSDKQAKQLVALQYIKGNVSINELSILSNKIEDIAKNRNYSLNINGSDLLSEFKIKPGRWVKECLSHLLNFVYYHKLENEKEVLLNWCHKKLEDILIERKNTENFIRKK